MKSRTYETYYGTFINQIEPFFKNVQCSQINEQLLDKYSVAVQTSQLHTFATQAIEEGINPKTVSELLGRLHPC